ncbi:DUF4304 domain-containing protein [Streptomyces sp. G-G2]|uniref:DUF4304 domain-containing protein n=1 Tax=Streptomyces sp. G-G2 TaxID=3046201 RepID=UPI0024B9E0AA|nr:DUF4304 domain-containing protein [Streptomyces sp. G-G2]MDJ0383136.1 DUF4304 domain-containing protein [Streptomyces sp. G-G2]
MNATDLFHQMLRERIAPALREAGFTGAGREYRLAVAAPDHALIGFQRSAGSTPDRCRFTVNLRAVGYEEHESLRRLRPALGTRLSANRVGPVGWHARIGQLLGHPHDHWWTITDERSADAVAEDVVDLVQRHAVPALWGRLTGHDPVPGPSVDPRPECLDVRCVGRPGRDGADEDTGTGTGGDTDREAHADGHAEGDADHDAYAFDPDDLIGTVVYEVGERQAWPYLVFHDEEEEVEGRLTIDASWRLGQPASGWVRVGHDPAGEERIVRSPGATLPTHRMALLGELGLCRVSDASAGPDGSLHLRFETGTPRETRVTVSGTPHARTVATPWRFDGWTRV